MRILEQEVMDDALQVEAYNSANQLACLTSFLLSNITEDFTIKSIADLGCGSGNYYLSLFEKFPEAKIIGFDASENMLNKARVNSYYFNSDFINSKIEQVNGNYNLIFSSLLLHQLPDPNVLWQTIKRISINNKFYLFDILRIEDDSECDKVIEAISPIKNDIFNSDFKNSLKAAFTEEEIKQQLLDNNIKANIEIINLTPEFKIIFITGDTDVG
jgi:ubiquinone/menaquinone biosynthesis C-methylase UbiE